MSAKVSIIVTAYNAETFVSGCLNNLMRMTYRDLEIILIDDGSTDSTGAIADSYSAPVRIIHQHNRGVSAARNAGIRAAKGDFILFCDIDDEYHHEAVEKMMELVGEEVDIVAGQLAFKPFKAEPLKCKDLAVSGLQMAVNTLYQKPLYNNSVCGKLFRRSLFDKIEHFREGLRYEDLEISMRLFVQARKAVILDAPVYYYRQHGSSFMHKWSDQRLDALKVTESLLKEAAKYGPEMEKAALSRRFSAAFNMYLLARRNGRRDIASFCKSILRNGRRQALTDPNVRLKNKLGALLTWLI